MTHQHEPGEPVSGSYLEHVAGAETAAAVDQPRIAAAVREILLAVGEDPDRDGLRDTPARVARSYAEITEIRLQDPGRIARLAATRKRRTVAEVDGAMMIVAADHPARGALGSGARKLGRAHV